MKKTLAILMVLALALTSVFGCAAPKAEAPAAQAPAAEASKTEAAASAEGEVEFPEMYIQLASPNPASDTNHMHQAIWRFVEKVSEKTNGKVVIEEIADGQLGNERDTLEGVKMGTIDMLILSNSMFTNFVDECSFAELPFMFRDQEEVFKLYDSELWDNMVKEKLTPATDVIPLGWYAGGFRNMINTKHPITQPADLVGMKIRGQENRIVVAMYQALGANCTPMPVSEVVAAVQQGTVDGADFPLSSMLTYGYPQFVENLAKTQHLWFGFGICISTRLWNKLTPELQQVFIEAAEEAEVDQRQWLLDFEAETLVDVGKTMKITEVDYDAFAAKMTPVYEEFRPIVGEEFFDACMELLGKSL